MKVRIKKHNQDGIMRAETSGRIMEILINEDFMNPNNESIAICFRGKSSSGIIDLTPEEVDRLMATVRQRMHLIKGMGKLRE